MAKRGVHRNFGKLHALHVEALTRHLIECRRVFDGDLDLFLVLAIIGERSFSVKSAPDDMSYAEFTETSVSAIRTAPINLQSIADFSGIPRETVRRKVEVLIDRGWVARDARRFLTVTDLAKTSLYELTDSAQRYLLDLENGLAGGGRSPTTRVPQ